MNGTSFILINKWLKIVQVTKILIAHLEKQVLCKFFTKIIIFELYISLTNMNCLVCIMQSHKMKKFDKIISYLRPDEHKILMEKLHKFESRE